MMNKKTNVFIFLFFAQLTISFSQNTLTRLLLNDTSTIVKKVISNKEKYRLQIIYTQINRDKNNVPTFTKYTFNVNDSNYFYPASLVKLPTIALALEKIDSLNIPQLNKYTWLKIDSAYQCQHPVLVDTTSKDGHATLAHYIKKMLLVSDNNAYNHLFEFLGADYINDRLAQMGYTNMAISQRLSSACDSTMNRYTNPFTFYDSTGTIIYQQPLIKSVKDHNNPLKPAIGNAFIDERGKLVKQPKDFTNANYIPLSSINDILISLVCPQSVDRKKRFNLTEDDYKFIYTYMSMYPRESDYPHYEEKTYPDNYKKYYRSGSTNKKILNDSVRIFNIVGLAYGFMSDCSYIVNYDKKIEFFLSTVIYVNRNEVINDGKYEYQTIGFPFLTELEKTIYNYECTRKKEYLPDLTNFKLR